MKVVKRDGRSVVFDRDKIKNAVLKAFEEVDGEITQESKNKSSDIASYIANQEKEELSVEEIQDMVEEKLMQSRRKDVAKAFILYRNDRTRIRENKTQLMKDITENLWQQTSKTKMQISMKNLLVEELVKPAMLC